MNEFEWRRQMRDLRLPLAPRQDLWASIDAALNDAEPAITTHLPTADGPSRNPRGWLIAASFAASALLAGAIGWHARQIAAPAHVASTQRTASAWKPADPRLAGAATQLDAARMELQQAIQQAPDSPALQRLLMRTEHQQNQLRQLASDAS